MKLENVIILYFLATVVAILKRQPFCWL